MTLGALAPSRRQDAAGARLAIGAVVAALVPLVVVLRLASAGPESLPVPDAVVALCLPAVLVGPVVAGLAGWSSLLMLWSRADVLAVRTRRLHLVSLLLVAAYAVVFTGAWGAGALAWSD